VIERLASMRGDPRSILAKIKNIFEFGRDLGSTQFLNFKLQNSLN
jgi:hypothetical protein